MTCAYLHHGSSTQGPFITESVPVLVKELDWQKAGKTWTATGYGKHIATPYVVLWEGKWRRVYKEHYNAFRRNYIRVKSGDIETQILE